MMELRAGLPDALRAEAAALYWNAFGGKLGRVLGPERLALAFVERVMRADHCIVALGPEGLLGLAGFKTPEGSFAGGSPADLRAVYGRWGGVWRSGVMQLLGGEADSLRFLLDGLCVRPDMRGRGIGSALLAAICDEGRARGYGAVRLDVVDTNPRARALYERRGFVLDRSTPIGPLRLVFGFRAAHTMVHQL